MQRIHLNILGSGKNYLREAKPLFDSLLASTTSKESIRGSSLFASPLTFQRRRGGRDLRVCPSFILFIMFTPSEERDNCLY